MVWSYITPGTFREEEHLRQRQKFHTDEAIQCLHNKSSSHGLSNTNLSNFTCLLVDFGKLLCSSANELQQNSNASFREDYIPQILTVLLEILRVYISPLWPFVFCLSFVNNSQNNVTAPSTNQRFWPDSGQILSHQYGISVAESQKFLCAKHYFEKRMFSQARHPVQKSKFGACAVTGYCSFIK